MIARELVKFPFSFSQGGIEGSRGVDHVLRIMSMDVAGSDRVHTAHINCSRSDASTSSFYRRETERLGRCDSINPFLTTVCNGRAKPWRQTPTPELSAAFLSPYRHDRGDLSGPHWVVSFSAPAAQDALALASADKPALVSSRKHPKVTASQTELD